MEWVLTVLFLIGANPAQGETVQMAEYATLEECFAASQAWASYGSQVLVAKCSPKGKPTWRE